MTLSRNSLTLINRVFSTRQFWNGRAASLEQQSTMPIEHPKEMSLPLSETVARLKGDAAITGEFESAFGQGPDVATLQRALAAYLRSLVSGASRVDAFEAGDPSVLTPSEQRGRVLFRGKARCTACHTGSNYSDEDFHNTGFHPGNADPGRFSVSNRERRVGAFKTPTLRDISRTAPYLHDGSARSPERVVEIYDLGGLHTQNRDSRIRPLGLSAQERSDLVAYLRALDGTSLTGGPPPRAATPTQKRRR